MPLPSVDDSLGLKLLPALLSMVAGSADAISFLGLGGLFVAQITGNLIILVAHLVSGAGVHVDALLSVPVFILALILTRVLVARLKAAGIETLGPLLVVQLILLAGFLTLGLAADARANPDAPTAVLAAMLGVSAMAAQNALVQVSVRGAPTTAVMTTDITRVTMDLGEILLGTDPSAIAAARRRASHTLPAIVGFAVGAALGASLYAILGLASLGLPTGLACVSLSAVHTRAAARRRAETRQGVARPGGGCPTPNLRESDPASLAGAYVRIRRLMRV